MRSSVVSRCLAYHEISETDAQYSYCVSKQQFREHVAIVRAHMAGHGLEQSEIAITFDDGHISQFSAALPVLQEASSRAMFFVTVNWIDKREGYMSWQQARELSQLGHGVQSHGLSHALLTKCSHEELKEELVRSKQVLEDNLGQEVDAISMPGGRWNSRVLEACREAGYKRVFTSDPFVQPTVRSGLQITGRLMISKGMSARTLVALLNGETGPTLQLRAKHYLSRTGKLVLGNSAYQTVWRLASGKSKSLESAQEASSQKKMAD